MKCPSCDDGKISLVGQAICPAIVWWKCSCGVEWNVRDGKVTVTKGGKPQ